MSCHENSFCNTNACMKLVLSLRLALCIYSSNSDAKIQVCVYNLIVFHNDSQIQEITRTMVITVPALCPETIQCMR